MPTVGDVSMPLVEYDEVHAPRLWLRGERDQVLERASEATELGNHELVPGARGDQRCRVEFGARGLPLA